MGQQQHFTEQNFLCQSLLNLPIMGTALKIKKNINRREREENQSTKWNSSVHRLQILILACKRLYMQATEKPGYWQVFLHPLFFSKQKQWLPSCVQTTMAWGKRRNHQHLYGGILKELGSPLASF